MGLSGRIQAVPRPIMTVTQPRVTNMAFQPLKEAPVTCWKANDIRPPMIWAAPRLVYQNANLGACSDLVYHWLLINVRDGPIEASKMPKNILATRRVL